MGSGEERMGMTYEEVAESVEQQKGIARELVASYYPNWPQADRDKLLKGLDDQLDVDLASGEYQRRHDAKPEWARQAGSLMGQAIYGERLVVSETEPGRTRVEG